MAPTCPTCAGTRVIPVADHYATEVRRPEADPAEAAPFAPPLTRALWPGVAALFCFFMALLSPGFVGPERGLTVGLAFALPGVAAIFFWLRARRTDRLRQAAYRAESYCPDCRHRF